MFLSYNLHDNLLFYSNLLQVCTMVILVLPEDLVLLVVMVLSRPPGLARYLCLDLWEYHDVLGIWDNRYLKDTFGFQGVLVTPLNIFLARVPESILGSCHDDIISALQFMYMWVDYAHDRKSWWLNLCQIYAVVAYCLKSSKEKTEMYALLYNKCSVSLIVITIIITCGVIFVERSG